MQRPGSNDSRLYAYVALLLAALAWAGNVVVGRDIRDQYGPVELTFYRWSVACVCLYLVGRRQIHADFDAASRNAGRLLIAAVCAMAGYHVLQYFALSRLPASDVAVIVGMTPVCVALAQAIGRRALPEPALALGVCIGACGVFLVCNRAAVPGSSGDRSWSGIGAASLAMLCWSYYSMRANRFERMSWVSALFYMALASSAMLLPFYLFDVAMSGVEVPSAKGVAQVLYVAIPASVVAYALYHFGIQQLGALKAAQFNCLIPAFASVLAAVFLGEALAPKQIVGVGLVVVALNLVMLGKTPADAR